MTQTLRTPVEDGERWFVDRLAGDPDLAVMSREEQGQLVSYAASGLLPLLATDEGEGLYAPLGFPREAKTSMAWIPTAR